MISPRSSRQPSRTDSGKAFSVLLKAIPAGTAVRACLVLGSGWGDISCLLGGRRLIPFSRIPSLGKTTVSGHGGWISIADFENGRVLIFEGRHHLYEGVGWGPVVFPAHLCLKMRIPVLLLTNAAGSVRHHLQPGSLMAITDHINMMGANPPVESSQRGNGIRFIDQSAVYDSVLTDMMLRAGRRARVPVKHGTYVAVSGPTYETPAEARAIAGLGGDAVGMSTVPEAIVANAGGVKVAALSCITNYAAGISKKHLDHAAITDQSRLAMPGAAKVIREFLRSLCTRR